MNNSTLYRLLPVLLTLVLSLPYQASGQLKKSKKFHDEKEETSKYWYGGGLNLNFSSDGYNSIFTFGISPMAGYKLNSFISVGPRVSLDWTTGKFSSGPSVYPYNSVDVGLGVFARFKFLQTFFAHLEYSTLNETQLTGYIVNNQLEKSRHWRDIALLGLGYNSNEKWGYEIYINYDFLEDKNSLRVPIIYRGGITYNF